VNRTRGGSWAAWAASLVVAVGLLAYFLRGIGSERILDTAVNASPGPFLAFLGLFATGIAARTTRFWVLLGRAVPFRTVLSITLVRNLLVDLLPARLGELSYVYLVTTKGKRPVEDGVATLAIAFLLDFVALSPLILVALLVVGGGTLIPTWTAWTASVILGGGGIVAVLLAGPIARRLSTWLARGDAVRWRAAGAARLSTLAASFDQAKRERLLLPALVLSLVVRVCKYGSAYCLVLSLLVPLGYSMAQLGVFRIFLGSVAAEVAASLPVHGLAGFGTYEAAWTLALEELGYPRDHAIISGLLAHAITQGIEYVLGGAALVWIFSRRQRAL
jgi:uncharacterized membrane protein YbhN (UPF0104 family)